MKSVKLTPYPVTCMEKQKTKTVHRSRCPFTVTNDELRDLIYSPDIYAVNLNIDGKECKAILKEIQFHARNR